MQSYPARYRCVAVTVFLTSALCATQAQLREPRVQPEICDRSLSFSVPSSTATYPLGINDTGIVTGYSVDSAQASHGFVRDVEGNISTFDVPGSVLTMPTSINTAGDIAGYYEVTAGTPQGFLRD